MAAEVNDHSKLNAANHLLVDQNLIRVPLELLRKNYKTAQRSYENQREYITNILKNPQSSSTPSITIQNAVHRLENLKRKLESLRQDEENLQRQLRVRLNHMDELYRMQSLSDVKYEEWAKVRLNRLLVDDLLRCGHEKSAKELAEVTGVADMVDVDAYGECHRIEESLEKGETKECLSWCADNKSSLKKINSDLEYELRLQQYIELIRTQDPPNLIEATRHARKHMAQNSDTSSTIHASGLLAFPPTTTVEPYASYYSPTRWKHLSALFLRAYQQLISLPEKSPFHCALSAGLSALKTPSCHSHHLSTSSNKKTTAKGTSVCPICSTELNELAREVPYAHHAKSNVESDAVMLPNGRVYGLQRLKQCQDNAVAQGDAMARSSGRIVHGAGDPGMMRDPLEPLTVFGMEEVRKVYIT